MGRYRVQPDRAATVYADQRTEQRFLPEVNLTQEILKFDLIRSAIPNRGLAQDDINLFGLHYLQQISDAITFEALHIEPGIWINIPKTNQPDVPPTVARMASIPHGTTFVAQGQAFEAPPPGQPVFTPANTTPFLTVGNTPITFPEFTLTNPSVFRIACRRRTRFRWRSSRMW